MGGLKEWNIQNDYSSPVVKVMLEELIERKEKLKKLEKYNRYSGYLTLILLSLLLLVCYIEFTQRLSSSYQSLLTSVLNNSLFLLVLLLTGLSLIYVQYFHKKVTKAEKEYEELREELMNRSSELWEDDTQWLARDHVFHYMKAEHDINLYYK
ncbi:DUF2663 family protein [Alkalihalobacillus hemicellulosilyticus]|uniref:DUF2663 family protein n=1 Tax=Halalkalibacter hemicellulosilyticusJCM 9152 TaxID=1236971 RepID=W4QAJ6_9BACI|nr:DUF2663 family protein [Halalkalibacter hemicellulosilyticus]GAE28982.1 hypothetical protein JCM9152_321 [Halalkalibacter hemicellulosilyticusJCM 9152]